jgi:exodeoxyribonuclease VII small subunit
MTPTKPNPNTTLPPVKELSYEQALTELETIVASLESNKLPLDETMSLYERGQSLTKHCVELLDKAELRVKQLSGDTLVDMEMGA